MFLLRCFSRKLEHGGISKRALERSLSTNLPKIRPHGSNKSQKIIVTLDPNKFAEKEQQCLHIGNLQCFRPYFSSLKQSSSVVVPRIYYDLIDMKTRWAQYPPNTRAFLYYCNSPKKPRIAGELRLRVISSNDPASFKSGSDLLLKNGRPWSRPLIFLSKYYLHLYEILKKDRLVPDDLVRVLSTLPPRKPRYSLSQYLYTINDPFIVDFSHPDLYFFVITEQGVESLEFKKLFFDGRREWNGLPYTGSILAQFERLTLPDHKGTRAIVLRFLRILTPVKCVFPLYDNYLCYPKEGELYQKTFTRTVKVWSYNVDEPGHHSLTSDTSIKRQSLKLLWDT